MGDADGRSDLLYRLRCFLALVGGELLRDVEARYLRLERQDDSRNRERAGDRTTSDLIPTDNASSSTCLALLLVKRVDALIFVLRGPAHGQTAIAAGPDRL